MKPRPPWSSARRRLGADPVQRGALADRGACPLMAAWCRRSPRAPMSICSTASSSRAMKEAGVGFDATVGGRGRRRARPDRRRHRRPHHGEGDRDGAQHAADRGEPSRGACADPAADLRAGISLLPVPRLRRPHPDRRGASASAIMCGSAPPSTTPWAKPSTRSQRCSACPIPAARRSNAPRSGGDPTRFAFPRPMLGRADANFSLSGLKTAVRNEASRLTPLEPKDISDLCAGFQAAVLESTADRLSVGLKLFAREIRTAARAGRRRRRRRQSGDPRRAAGCRGEGRRPR